ncbi:MAG: tRNA (adenosine(37)-N6)-threonylcarbamoyltransferase complex dimerization subunit type 1 TsaB, partial [Candidatus Omnitrophica bacterium]|nr:tRNA (adenosine(37)-N6)-threonylcarbamoyltransferase complex dimerization subunit type 1 TsaB [Candidatus Omnitrophota bacterium]
MNLLIIDTSSDNLSLAIFWENKLVCDINRFAPKSASALVEEIELQLKKRKLKISLFDAFVVGSGPGSFTGMRISFSLIKAFSLALSKPIISLGSFLACAYQFPQKQSLAVVVDARKNLIYGATFKKMKSGVIVREKKERLVDLDEFVKDKENYYFITYDQAIRTRIKFLSSAFEIDEKNIYPKASALILPAIAAYNKGSFNDFSKIVPLYLHPKTCQIRKREK